MARRLRRPQRRTPDFPPWGKDECRKCAAPVRHAFLTATEVVEVGMRPAPMSDRRADVACAVMDGRLIARLLGRNQRPEVGETVWIRHELVCPEIRRTEQLALLEETP